MEGGQSRLPFRRFPIRGRLDFRRRNELNFQLGKKDGNLKSNGNKPGELNYYEQLISSVVWT